MARDDGLNGTLRRGGADHGQATLVWWEKSARGWPVLDRGGVVVGRGDCGGVVGGGGGRGLEVATSSRVGGGWGV